MQALKERKYNVIINRSPFTVNLLVYHLEDQFSDDGEVCTLYSHLDDTKEVDTEVLFIDNVDSLDEPVIDILSRSKFNRAYVVGDSAESLLNLLDEFTNEVNVIIFDGLSETGFVLLHGHGEDMVDGLRGYVNANT